MDRRGFLRGIAGILATSQMPAIVSASSLMKGRAIVLPNAFDSVEFAPTDWAYLQHCIDHGLTPKPRAYVIEKGLYVPAGKALLGSGFAIAATPGFADDDTLIKYAREAKASAVLPMVARIPALEDRVGLVFPNYEYEPPHETLVAMEGTPNDYAVARTVRRMRGLESIFNEED